MHNYRKADSENAVRYSPDFHVGLTAEQVSSRVSDNLTNHTKHAVGKSYTEIIFTDVFNFFNIVLFIIAGFMIYAGYYSGLFFLAVIIPNMVIGLYEDIKARVLLGKLRLMTQPKADVIRDGTEQTIETKDIVLDDVIHLSSASQISADGRVLSGSVLVNESFITGESRSIEKKIGDPLYSGSFVVSGKAYMQATCIGKERYVEKIQSQANRFSRSPSQILKSFKLLFRVLDIVVICMAALMVIVYAVQGKFSSAESVKAAIGPIAGSLVAMIPSGLYLLTSMALATTVISLSRKHAQVQDFYSVEMLARSNVLCVDKTGTITDGSMTVKEVISLGAMRNEEISQAMSNLLAATGDDNATAKAFKNYFKEPLNAVVKQALPFNSDNKYSAATFGVYGTYVLGAPEFLNFANKDSIVHRAADFEMQGLRVLALGKTMSPIADGKVDGTLEGVAILVLQDHIKDDVHETFRWFRENKVAIKVISGDNPIAVSQIAGQAGVENSEKYVSLQGKSDDEVRAAALEYTVFGRVTPEQKEIIVKSLKSSGKTVAMTGDGVNDILALKRADCSIAMASGADAARDVSHLVLLDSNFSSLPAVVAEGRRVVNNLQRTASLFLTKTIFAVFFTVFFLLYSVIARNPDITYPFVTNNLYVWEVLGVGMSAFFLALEPNDEIIQGKFLSNVFRKAAPAAAAIICSVLAVFGCYALTKYFGIYTSINSLGRATATSILCFTVISMAVLLNVCTPFSKYRRIVFAAASVLAVIALVIAYFLTMNYGVEKSILLIDFNVLTLPNYMIALIVSAVVIAVYMLANTIASLIRKGAPKND